MKLAIDVNNPIVPVEQGGIIIHPDFLSVGKQSLLSVVISDYVSHRLVFEKIFQSFDILIALVVGSVLGMPVDTRYKGCLRPNYDLGILLKCLST